MIGLELIAVNRKSFDRNTFRQTNCWSATDLHFSPRGVQVFAEQAEKYKSYHNFINHGVLKDSTVLHFYAIQETTTKRHLRFRTPYQSLGMTRDVIKRLQDRVEPLVSISLMSDLNDKCAPLARLYVGDTYTHVKEVFNRCVESIDAQPIKIIDSFEFKLLLVGGEDQ